MSQKAADTVKAVSKNATFSVNRTKLEGDPCFSLLNPVLSLHQKLGNSGVRKMHASGLIQAKLKIGKPGDKYEQEADRVAKEVVSKPGPGNTSQLDEDKEIQTCTLVAKITPLIRRTSLDDEGEIRSKLLQGQAEKEEESLQGKPLQKQDDDEVQEHFIPRQNDDEEELQSQAQEEENPVQAKIISRQTDDDEVQENLFRRQSEDEEKLQSQSQNDEEPVQGKMINRRADADEDEFQPQNEFDEKEDEIRTKLIPRQADHSEASAMGKLIQKQEDEDVQEKLVQPQKPYSGVALSHSAETSVRSIKGGGRSLPHETRSFMERRFGADFNSVRIHTDSRADSLASFMNARAFTHGTDIVFKSGQYSPETSSGKQLLAHELTHVVQQNSRVAPKFSVSTISKKLNEEAVQKYWGESWVKKGKRWGGKAWKGVKKIGSTIARGFSYFMQKAKNFIANRVRSIPGYRFISGFLGKDPISGEKAKSGGGLLKSIFTLLNKEKTYDQLIKADILGKAMKLIRDAFQSANLTKSFIFGSIKSILAVITINPLTWKKAAGMFVGFLGSLVAKVIKVGWTLLSHVVKWILEKAKEYAFKLLKAIPGFGLIMELFGNPVGEKEKKKKKKKSFGFVRLIFKLLKKEKTYDNLVKANILGKIAAIFKGAFSKAGLSWGYIKKSIAGIWNFLEKNPVSWIKTAGMVVNFIKFLVGKLFRVAGTVILKVPLLILEGFLILVGAPVKKIMGIINKGRRVILKIAGNPIRFIGNLFKAIKKGFSQFKENIWKHLKAGLFGWLMGALEGAEIKLPQKWDLKGIIYLVTGYIFSKA